VGFCTQLKKCLEKKVSNKTNFKVIVPTFLSHSTRRLEHAFYTFDREPVVFTFFAANFSTYVRDFRCVQLKKNNRNFENRFEQNTVYVGFPNFLALFAIGPLLLPEKTFAEEQKKRKKRRCKNNAFPAGYLRHSKWETRNFFSASPPAETQFPSPFSSVRQRLVNAVSKSRGSEKRVGTDKSRTSRAGRRVVVAGTARAVATAHTRPSPVERRPERAIYLRLVRCVA